MLETTANETAINTWKQFAHDMHGRYETGLHTLLGRVSYRFGPWRIVADTYKPTQFAVRVQNNKMLFKEYTRFRAAYANSAGFVCAVRSKTWVDKITGIFSSQIGTGDADFDDKLVVKANDHKKAARLFKQARIRDLIQLHSNINLLVASSQKRFLGSMHPNARDEVCIEVEQVLTNLEGLMLLNELLVLVLDGLCKMDAGCRKQFSL